ncbi:DUF6683 family protein [Parasphingorhabdus cellanae]|uniref:Uncharacterized protein n=1 Tax=Parasphingorhabdus cellanae TaxID=2806553 RepID=A0ABX7T4T0_9SPHN|nr:DUF6683 family protein [Parasphingorhabdus cellanae]QTD56141.1 hypothetical protein J4G78_00595 [Parasphingorhabdus cellanae]
MRKYPSKFLATLSVLAAGLFGLSPAHAQFDIGGGFIDAGVHGAVMKGVTKKARKSARTPVPGTAQRAPFSAGQQKAALQYEPSMQQRKKNFANFVKKTRKADPAGATQLEQMLTQNDVIGLISREVSSAGLSVNNVADAYTIWWITAWDGAQGTNRDLTRGLVSPVQQQATTALLSTPQFMGATDAQKQELADAYLVQAALIGGYVEATQSDPAQLDKVKAAIKQGARAAGMDLDKMILTDSRGFQPRETSDASDAKPDQPEERLASATEKSGENEFSYGLIALASGVGLAGAFGLGRLLR